jgi:ribose transport system ATP-binding protein
MRLDMSEPVLRLSGIKKSFPGVAALKGVDITIRKNEILGLVGENGAGKSTLMKIMVGLQRPDEGTLSLRGSPTVLSDPLDAIQRGIGMVFQEGCMIPNLSAMDNMFLGHERIFMRLGFLDRARMRAAAGEQLSVVGLGALDPAVVTGSLTAAQKQMIEIARLLWLSARYGIDNPILILDEPTTVLQESEARIFFDLLADLKKRASIVFISHRLEEVVEISDRIVVLKDGSFMAELSGAEASVKGIERLMVGHELAAEHFRESMQIEASGEVVLETSGLALEGKFRGFDLALRRGEIVSLVGLLGSGKEEVCKCLTGAERATGGTMEVSGKTVRFNSPKDAIAHSIGCIPIDRRNEGLATSLDVADNINLLVLDRMRSLGFIDPRKEKANAEQWVKECLVKTPGLQTPCATLSGGNQQKVVIAKWLAAEARILVLDHPTRGIDVGAKDEIYRRIRELAAAGLSLIVMCDTLEEDIGLCNRMLVMKDGEVRKEIPCPKENKPTALDVIGYIV